jgi:hypothetical protein
MRRSIKFCFVVLPLVANSTAWSQTTTGGAAANNRPLRLETLYGTDANGMPKRTPTMRRAERNAGGLNPLAPVNQIGGTIPQGQQGMNSGGMGQMGQAGINQGMANNTGNVNATGDPRLQGQQLNGGQNFGGANGSLNFNGQIQQNPDGTWVDRNGNPLTLEDLRNLAASGSFNANGAVNGNGNVAGPNGGIRATDSMNGGLSQRQRFNRTPNAFQRAAALQQAAQLQRLQQQTGQQQLGQPQVGQEQTGQGLNVQGQGPQQQHLGVQSPQNGQFPAATLQGNGNIQGGQLVPNSAGASQGVASIQGNASGTTLSPNGEGASGGVSASGEVGTGGGN